MMLVGSAQAIGFPIPEGGAGMLTQAMVRRLEAKGGRVECNARVARVIIRRGRAVAVRTDGRARGRRPAGPFLADVSAPQLFLNMIDPAAVPDRMIRALKRFQWDNGTGQDRLGARCPDSLDARGSAPRGDVHVTEGMDALTIQSAELARGEIPARPFLVLGQYAYADATRQPPGKDTAWAYTHIPQRVRGDAGPDGLTGRWDAAETERFVERMESQVEAVAPGFKSLIRARHVMAPDQLEARDANLVSGALNGGTAQLHQQLFLRPVPGLGRAETPIAGLYLASASAHPGGGVHGGPGANAARAVLKEPRILQPLAARIAAAAVGGEQP
jgi:phytoene dehydrogenase-like protein